MPLARLTKRWRGWSAAQGGSMTVAGPAAESAEQTAAAPPPPVKRNKIKTGEGRLAFLLVAPTVLLLALVGAASLVPWAIPTAVTSKLWIVIFDPQGILNNVLHKHILWTSSQWPARFAIVIADVWKTAPFIALLILAGLQGISADLYESA